MKPFVQPNNPLVLWRERMGMSRAELARESGAPYTTLTVLESGLPLSMSKLTAQRIAPLLHIAVEDIRAAYQEYRQACVNKKPVPACSVAAATETGAK